MLCGSGGADVRGVEVCQGPREPSAIGEFFEPFESLVFDDGCADVYGSVRTQLERVGRPIGPNDLMIAAITLQHSCSLVTHNVQEFSRVEGLQIEDWEEAPT